MKLHAALVATVGILVLTFLASGCGGGESNPFGVESELVTAADHPVAMAFAPDGRLFYAEQLTGDIRIVSADGQLQAKPFAHVDAHEAGTLIEWGLMGLALDPDFATNHYVYAYFTEFAASGPPPEVKPVLVRLTEKDNTGQDAKVLIDDLPATSSFFNVAGTIHFGRDGFLYVSAGDYDTADSAGNLSLAQGKMLRIDKSSGGPAPDNPFVGRSDADPRIFAYGFREDFDFAFHPQSGQIYGTDQTPVTCSELNIIKSGANGGWPYGQFPWSDCTTGQQGTAIHHFAKEDLKPEDFLSFSTPKGLAFVSGSVYPLLGDSLLVCQRETQLMRHLQLGGANFDQVTVDDVVVKDCQAAIAVAPDGTAYYSNDKEIRRLVQKQKST